LAIRHGIVDQEISEPIAPVLPLRRHALPDLVAERLSEYSNARTQERYFRLRPDNCESAENHEPRPTPRRRPVSDPSAGLLLDIADVLDHSDPKVTKDCYNGPLENGNKERAARLLG
jgi:hypothetical protein